LGCLAYAFIGAALAAILGFLFAFLFSVIGVLLEASDDAGTALLLGGLALGLVLGPLLAWRSYRRRAAGEFRIHADRVEYVAA
jgi:ABC-type uncharacterized transport system permease subunit